MIKSSSSESAEINSAVTSNQHEETSFSTPNVSQQNEADTGPSESTRKSILKTNKMARNEEVKVLLVLTTILFWKAYRAIMFVFILNEVTIKLFCVFYVFEGVHPQRM